MGNRRLDAKAFAWWLSCSCSRVRCSCGSSENLEDHDVSDPGVTLEISRIPTHLRPLARSGVMSIRPSLARRHLYAACVIDEIDERARLRL